MPSRFPFAGHGTDDAVQEMGEDLEPKRPRRSSLLKNIGGLLRRHNDQRDIETALQPTPSLQPPPDEFFRSRRSSLPEHGPHRRAIPSLPRPQTFRRQESERREKLLEVPPSPTERRALSLDRRRGYSATAVRRPPLSREPDTHLSASAPDIAAFDQEPQPSNDGCSARLGDDGLSKKKPPELPPLQIPSPDAFNFPPETDLAGDEADLSSVQADYDQRWILNLSMCFRDKTNREKFFVTFAEKPTKWRRLTISLDYRRAPPGSLEADLSTLHYQKDKSFHIFEAIRESLAEIQFYNTVTNLKLETTPEDNQLHVHVREDANEIIKFPSIDLFDHVETRRYPESELEFISHLSGFVYKVCVDGRVLIKKEIPGPDTVDDFLYEVNALDALLDSRRVVDLEGLVTDESGLEVKGLLISYASQGALVDVLYDHHDTTELKWRRREKWAKQIVEGLSDIHEAGFVQGDFTLSNIVIDEHDDAMIIDINRRGCPVGWEPPELSRLIDSGQRISMCIGVKTDIFQLGMVLWALATIVDEPEREERPLRALPDSFPIYYRSIVECCLSERPQGRLTAKKCFRQFPSNVGRASSSGGRSVDFVEVEDVRPSDHSISTHRSDKEYIDPDMAVTLEDVGARGRRRGHQSVVSPFTTEQVTYFNPRDPDSNPASTVYPFDSSGSWVVGRTRGRSPVSSRRRRSSPFAKTASSSPATSLSRSPPSRSRRRCRSESSDKKHDADAAICQQWPDGAFAGEDNDLAEKPDVAVLNARVADIRCEDAGCSQFGASLLHTDSGFDEQMTEHLDAGNECSARDPYPTSLDELPQTLPLRIRKFVVGEAEDRPPPQESSSTHPAREGEANDSIGYAQTQDTDTTNDG